MNLGPFGWEAAVAVGGLLLTGISGFVVLLWRMAVDRTKIGAQIEDLTEAVKALQSDHSDLDEDTDAIKSWRSGVDASIAEHERRLNEQDQKRGQVHDKIDGGFRDTQKGLRDTHVRIDSLVAESSQAHSDVAGRLGKIEGMLAGMGRDTDRE